MKEELEKEVCILAENIINNRGKLDFLQLKTELGKLYEKISILSFVEKYYQSLGASDSRMEYTMGKVANFIDEQQNEIDIFDFPVEATTVQPMKFSQPEKAVDTPVQQVSAHQQNVTQSASVREVYQQVTQNVPSTQSNTTNQQYSYSQPQNELVQNRFTQPLQSVQQEPEWVKPANQENKPLESYISQTQQLVFDKKEESEPKSAPSINDKFGKNAQIGLNDRLAFIRQLFFGSESEYNKVVQNIGNLHSVQDIALYIEQEVKPIYNHWRGKEEYEERFLNLMLKRFEM